MRLRLPALMDRNPAAKRIDLHCHSDASNRAAEAALNAINCPECYSAPEEVYAQAKRRGMDFVTITDHDSVEGVLRIAEKHDDVLVGEELTCWFPEDDCKMHVLVYGIGRQDHDALQSLAQDIYAVAEYVERNHRTIKDLCRTATEPHACAVLIYEYAQHHRGGALVLMNRA